MNILPSKHRKSKQSEAMTRKIQWCKILSYTCNQNVHFVLYEYYLHTLDEKYRCDGPGDIHLYMEIYAVFSSGIFSSCRCSLNRFEFL